MIVWVFSFCMLYLTVGEPMVESLIFKTILKSPHNNSAKITMYRRSFIRTWIELIALVLLLLYFKVPFKQLGFTPIDWPRFTWEAWILIAAAILYFVSFYLFTTILYRFSDKVKEGTIKSLLPFHHVIPAASNEKVWWTVNSLCSVIEEFFYRGFVVFFLMHIFPGCSFAWAAVGSVFLDGIRYVARWKAAIYVFYSSAFFALSYGLFHSIYPAMILHVIHDLRILLAPLDSIAKRALQNDK